jgi:hypothetical protein
VSSYTESGWVGLQPGLQQHKHKNSVAGQWVAYIHRHCAASKSTGQGDSSALETWQQGRGCVLGCQPTALNLHAGLMGEMYQNLQVSSEGSAFICCAPSTLPACTPAPAPAHHTGLIDSSLPAAL